MSGNLSLALKNAAAALIPVVLQAGVVPGYTDARVQCPTDTEDRSHCVFLTRPGKSKSESSFSKAVSSARPKTEKELQTKFG